jgi:SAM-dependent methyltransferase
MNDFEKPFLQAFPGAGLKNWWRGEMADRPLAESIPSLTAWFAQPCGQRLLEDEQQVLDELLPSLFGYHLLQMSVCETVDLASGSPIHHRVTMLAHVDGVPLPVVPGRQGLVSDFDQLPIESDSVDVVILHHVLDFSPHPHQVLKEINRILIPRGHVVIIGFNPYSLFGLWKAFASLFTRHTQWRYSSLAKRRLFDWFKLLDLEKARVTHTFFRPPGDSGLFLKRLSFLEKIGKRFSIPCGGVYIVLARKDICAVTPLKVAWEKTGKRLMGMAAAQPASPRIYLHQSQPPKSRRDLH